DFYVRQSDAIVYVSQLSLEQVRSRQPRDCYSRFHLIRGGADPKDFPEIPSNQASLGTGSDRFEIVFTGGMTGWEQLLSLPRQSLAKKLRQAGMNFGRYYNINVQSASSSPIFIGRAIKQVIEQNPSWNGKIRLRIYGNKFEQAETVLKEQGLLDVVSITGSVPHTEALQKLQTADLLFMPLPDRLDGTPGDRISLKTYEYLMTDRPILAAVPEGENRNYLGDKPGVYLVSPFDVEAMAQVIARLLAARLAGKTPVVDRAETRRQISYVKRGEELATLIVDVLKTVGDKKFSKLSQVIKTTNIPGHG
ncbi:MAG: glycosyltransferase, partial [Cyanobacteria bacterium P01_D01_bin.2]